MDSELTQIFAGPIVVLYRGRTPGTVGITTHYENVNRADLKRKSAMKEMSKINFGKWAF